MFGGSGLRCRGVEGFVRVLGEFGEFGLFRV